MIWNDEKIEKLRNLYEVTDNDVLSDILNIKRGTVVAKARSLGLSKSKEYMVNLRTRINERTRVRWSAEDDAYLVKNYKFTSNRDLSCKLGKSKKSIMKRLIELNLRRTAEDNSGIVSRKNKERNRDLSYEYVKSISEKYSTIYEFSYMDNSAYTKAKKSGWLSDFNHLSRLTGKTSIPQLIMTDILEFIFDEKCKINDRDQIKPLEIDCYFEKWRIGWEYNGRRFHNDLDDQKKLEMCVERDVHLFTIDEKPKNYRSYVENIKTQIINRSDDILRITGIKINEESILGYTPVLRLDFLMRCDEIDFCRGKTMKEIKSGNIEIYRKIKNFDISRRSEIGIVNERKPMKKFKDPDEYISYLISIKNKYENFSKLAMNEHVYRRAKKYSIPVDEIRAKVWPI